MRSRAWDNGWRNDFPSGPIGIWTWDSNRVVIEHNEAWGNRSGTRDGGGFTPGETAQMLNQKLVELGQAEEADVQPATVVEVEHRRQIGRAHV